jgi:thiol-disulfide isomerase/thioredoxin
MTLQEFNSILEDTFVVIDFYTPTCPPCKIIGPIYDTLPDKFSHITFVKTDCGGKNEIADKYKIGSVPTFLFFSHGKVVHTQYGGNGAELFEACRKTF